MSDTVIAQPGEAQSPSVRNLTARRILALVLVVLVLLLGLSAYLLYSALRVPTTAASKAKPIDTAGIVWVRSIYGTSNDPKDFFGQTQAAVPGEGGSLWVTDATHRSSLMQFGADGRYRGPLVSANASMPISSPSRIAVGSDGLIYICETALDRIHVLKPNGEDGGSFSVPQPVSIAVSDGRIAVGAVAGFAVLDMKGKPIGVVGSRGKGPDQFDYVHGIAFGPDGSVYVADSYNNRLSAYEPDGTRRWIVRTGAPSNSAEVSSKDMLQSTPPSDTALSQSDALQLPLGLTVDGAGRVVVVDMYGCDISVFNPKTGKLIDKFGDYGAEDGQFFYPVSIGYDATRDWFTVADAFNRRVQIVRIPGSSGSSTGMIAAAQRALAGPWRACAFPMLLLLLAIVVFAATHFARRRRARDEDGNVASDAEAASSTGM